MHCRINMSPHRKFLKLSSFYILKTKLLISINALHRFFKKSCNPRMFNRNQFMSCIDHMAFFRRHQYGKKFVMINLLRLQNLYYNINFDILHATGFNQECQLSKVHLIYNKVILIQKQLFSLYLDIFCQNSSIYFNEYRYLS